MRMEATAKLTRANGMQKLRDYDAIALQKISRAIRSLGPACWPGPQGNALRQRKPDSTGSVENL
jgi:hypothetical protein